MAKKKFDLTLFVKMGLATLDPKGLRNKSHPIGCGYCIHELTCSKHDPKINKAKLGCKEYKEFEKL
jgi:hypothetical protein